MSGWLTERGPPRPVPLCAVGVAGVFEVRGRAASGRRWRSLCSGLKGGQQSAGHKVLAHERDTRQTGGVDDEAMLPVVRLSQQWHRGIVLVIDRPRLAGMLARHLGGPGANPRMRS